MIKEYEMFKTDDRVLCTYNNKTGTVKRWVYNHFYQVVCEVAFDDGTEAAVTTEQLKLIKQE